MSFHLATGHPLAQVAADHCTQPHGPLIGGIACGLCWEQAIRDDERFAVQNDLPRSIERDPALVDDVAVRRVTSGASVPLTTAERRQAIEQMRLSGLTNRQIADRLRMSNSSLGRELGRITSLSEVA